MSSTQFNEDNEVQSSGQSESILQPIASLYGCTAAIAFMYYSWQFAQENGFVEWIMLGFFIPALKAPFWPLIWLLG